MSADYTPSASPKANILIIDDTPDNLTLLSAMLVAQGYKVRSVTKGTTGLRGAQAVPPDLILLDVNMPEMNGYEVCQRLKDDNRTRDIPVIFISALDDVLDKVQAFTVGGVDYITKPFQVAEVLARVENHLALRRLQLQLQSQNSQLADEIRQRRQVEERFAKAFRSSPSPIAIATLAENRFVEVNPSFLRISGYELEEVIGHTAVELRLGIAQNAYDQAIQQLQKTGFLLNQECEFRTKLGERRTVLLSVELIELAGVACTLNIVNDITERKRLENEFISLVSHELRTPLTSLMGALDLLAAGQLGNLTEQGKHVLNIAVTNTERLIRMVNDILDLERMKSGKIIMQKTQCNLAQLMIQSAEAMQTMADQAQIQLMIKPLDVEIVVDGDRILQTLTNLLSNAIKFSDSGSTVWLTATVKQLVECSPLAIAAPSADLSSKSTALALAQIPAPAILITVQDQGRGIPTDQLQTIFERFQQVDASDARQKGGTGLGLPICRSIIEQHGGSLWAESTLGQGSLFHVLLPLSQHQI
jgi:PAS domain S-box-containing protein